MKIVVLGGGGFIGCNLVAFLKKKGHWVRAVGSEFPDYRESQWSQADERFVCDLRNEESVFDAIRGCQWVIQLAANMGGVGFFHGGHDYYPYLDNQQINLNVLRVCEMLSIERLFFSASACIYPTHINQTASSPYLREDMIYPANCDMSYGWEKLMMLRLCERAPFDARVGIFDTIYGPFQEKEGERMKFPTAIATKTLKAAQDGKPIEVWGDGTQQRLFLFIDDALEKIYRILTTDNYTGPVNVCATEVVTVREVAELCCNIVGLKPNIIYDPTKPIGVLSRKSSNVKWLKDYGYHNRVGVGEGFEKLIGWLRSQ